VKQWKPEKKRGKTQRLIGVVRVCSAASLSLNNYNSSTVVTHVLHSCNGTRAVPPWIEGMVQQTSTPINRGTAMRATNASISTHHASRCGLRKLISSLFSSFFSSLNLVCSVCVCVYIAYTYIWEKTKRKTTHNSHFVHVK
jgi:hypothetical protein